MVEYLLAMEKMGVRFPLPAQNFAEICPSLAPKAKKGFAADGTADTTAPRSPGFPSVTGYAIMKTVDPIHESMAIYEQATETSRLNGKFLVEGLRP